jgi:murein DD-endopeptidase MepM/ murein hydrolase activator NlpD
MIVTVLAGAAGAASLVQLARQRQNKLTHSIAHVRRDARRDSAVLNRRVQRATRGLTFGVGRVHGHARWHVVRRQLIRERRLALSKMRASQRRRDQRLQELVRRRSATSAWLSQWGVLEVCPVRGPVSIADDFGVMVRKPGVPVHVHQGNDMMAATGTPIVAPFDGTAVAAPNVLGGQAVKVYGARGYVYNAHLSAYGQLGHVTTGTVIGYVGSTGDAGGPHDHFEWHPGNGPAVDPNPFLTVSCG